MPHAHLIFKLCRTNALLYKMAQLNPPTVSMLDRERMLDEMEAVVSNRRQARDMQSVHKLLETAHWISRWPTHDGGEAILKRG